MICLVDFKESKSFTDCDTANKNNRKSDHRMNKKLKKIAEGATVLFSLAFIFSISLTALITPDREYIKSERRSAADFPNTLSEHFTEELENYFLDNLPQRESLRLFRNRTLYSLGLKELDGIILSDNGLVKNQTELNENNIQLASDTFNKISEKYFSGEENIYLSVIYGKSHYSDIGGRSRLDPAKLSNKLASSLDFSFTYIDLEKVLSENSFYKTDIHWKSEELYPVARALSLKMKFPLAEEESFTKEEVASFVGTVGEQVGIYSEKDRLFKITDRQNAVNIADVSYSDSSEKGIYSPDALLENDDKYDFYLRGEVLFCDGETSANFFTKIENPLAENKKRLIIFRDSFARSLLPYLVGSYSEIFLVDLRAPTLFYSRYPDFFKTDSETDILFLFSADTINSTAIK